MGWDLWRLSSPTPHLKAEAVRTGYSGPTQPGFQYLQGQRLHNLSGPLFQHLTILNKIYSYQLKSLVFQPVSVAPCLIAVHLEEQVGLISTPFHLTAVNRNICQGGMGWVSVPVLCLLAWCFVTWKQIEKGSYLPHHHPWSNDTVYAEMLSGPMPACGITSQKW